MTIVTQRDAVDKAKVDAIEKKLLDTPEVATLIRELAVSATDANDPVRCMLQALLASGLQAEMDARLGYQSSNREGQDGNRYLDCRNRS
ncbi:hypothetical protein [Corynebacterium liangguodongii]|uniref:Uncharacterized protein n=1 Tax=Corynebacterium liangguodongii TaxID=2079535 RepID=A0A2S0WBJ8_9CORY|nr:hypothetical protein [Corynebacterium liangguodongii]AWB83137.1 hypothetical protein C3E79_00390 [Corynebacterium liangguodongii]PWB99262.1 hypothetical protein DF219_06685 [Corynebacterium liangguodongii]